MQTAIQNKIISNPAIYKIEIKSRIYIGSAINPNKRQYRHLSDLRNNKHHSKYLQKLYNKYGEQELQFKIVEECSKEDLLTREQRWLIVLFECLPRDRILNTYKAADSRLGCKHSDETKAKLSKANKGTKRRSLSEETKRKISVANKGKILSDLHKQKISETHKGKVRKPLSEETKRKISESKKGKKYSEELKEKLSRSHGFNPVWLIHDAIGSVLVKNIALFSSEYNLSHSHISSVISGKRKSHKGWRLA